MYRHRYILGSVKARLFRNGGSQAVRLPKECRFPEGQTEINVRREGRRVILEPLDEWSPAFLAALGAWPEEILRVEQVPLRKLKPRL
jgi:antitoxin VapB